MIEKNYSDIALIVFGAAWSCNDYTGREFKTVPNQFSSYILEVTEMVFLRQWSRFLLPLMMLATFGVYLAACKSDSSSNPVNYFYSKDTMKLLINEIKANIPEDKHSMQFVELRGEPGYTVKQLYLLVIDGGVDDNPGHLDYVQNLNDVTIGSNGLIIIKNKDQYPDVSTETTVINDPLIRDYDENELEDGVIEHDAITFMVVYSPSQGFTQGDDLDPDNNGVLELPEKATVVDSVGWLDGGDGIVYTEVVLKQSASDPDAATRFFEDVTPLSLDAWANGDIFEDTSLDESELPFENRYDPAQASANLPPNAKITPGRPNFKKSVFALLNEVLADSPSGAGRNEFIEIMANANQNLDGVYVAAIEGASGGVLSYVRNLTGAAVGRAGLLIIKNPAAYPEAAESTTKVDEPLFDNNGALGNAGITFLLVYSPNTVLSFGMDLDEDNDGSLDQAGELYQVLDAVAWNGEQAGDILYGEAFNTETTGAPMAATRYKDNRVVGAISWDYGQLDSNAPLAYVPTKSRNVPENGYLTPGGINIAEQAAAQVKPSKETARTTFTPPDADDVAFWHHPTDPTKGLVFATQKKAGYSIYDSNAATLVDVNPGNIRYNNVDVVYGFSLNGQQADLAVFSDRIGDKFAVYQIQENPPYLTNVTDPDANVLFGGEPGENTAYGMAIYKSPVNGRVYAFVTQADTYLVRQFELLDNQGTVGWNLIRTVTLSGGDDDEVAEGIVVDQEYGMVYICQEAVGVYRMDAEPGVSPVDVELTEDDMIVEEGDYNLIKDIEGISIYYLNNGQGFILISSQGSNTFSVFQRVGNDFINSFTVIDNGLDIDGSQECDGLDITNFPFGSDFPNGLVIVQDGQDTTDDPTDVGTNFKWIKWEDVAAAVNLNTDTTYDPRNPQNRR
ncbi:MAG: phytase [Pseudomonadota bacterium]